MTEPTVPNGKRVCTPSDEPVPRMWEAFAAFNEPEPDPEPVATVHQLPGTTPKPERRPDRDRRRTYQPVTGSRDKFSMLPESVLYNRDLSHGAVRLYAALQREMGMASPAMYSLSLCTIIVGQVAANIGASEKAVRLWLAALREARLIEYRPEDDPTRGLRVYVRPVDGA